MRSVIISALLVLALSLSVEAQAGVQMPCAAFGRICGCPSFVRAVSRPVISNHRSSHTDPLDG